MSCVQPTAALVRKVTSFCSRSFGLLAVPVSYAILGSSRQLRGEKVRLGRAIDVLYHQIVRAAHGDRVLRGVGVTGHSVNPVEFAPHIRSSEDNVGIYAQVA